MSDATDVAIVPPGVNGAVEVMPQALQWLVEALLKQRTKGLAEYGAPLTDRTEFPVADYLWGELADLVMYLARFRLDYEREQAANARLLQALTEINSERAREARRADVAIEHWRAFYIMCNPGLGERVYPWEMRKAPVEVLTAQTAVQSARSHVSFVPVELYQCRDWQPEPNEIGYVGARYVRVVDGTGARGA